MKHALIAAAVVWGVVTGLAVRGRAQEPQPKTIKVSGALYTNAQALRGEQVFKKYCLGCHRENLHSGEGDLSLTGPHFLEYWGLMPLGEMVRLIRSTMPLDAPPNTLTVQQTVDMVAYILWLNYYPVGAKELPADLDTINRWTLETPEEHLAHFLPKQP